MNRERRKLDEVTRVSQDDSANERRLTAFHEAGHASMFWFFQQRVQFRGIDMSEDEESHGRVRQSSIVMPQQIAYERDEHPRRTKIKATMLENRPR